MQKELNVVVTGHVDGKARLSHIVTGKTFDDGTYSGHAGGVTGLAFLVVDTREGKKYRLITASLDQTIKYWNIASGKEERTVGGHGGAITCLALGPRPEYSMVTGGTDQSIILWDPEVIQQRTTYTPGVAAIRAVAVSNNGRIIAAAGQDGTVRLYRAAKPEPKDNKTK